MNIKPIKEIIYEYGNEDYIKQLIYTSKEPLLIKIKDFPDKFNLDYFAKLWDGASTYYTYENDRRKSHASDNFPQILAQIKNNMPLRVFGQLFYEEDSAAIEQYVPLWQKLPFRPRLFKQCLKVMYFFGGRGAHTEMHFDREHCCNMHLCLWGKKKVLVFTQAQNDFLYKIPFIGDSIIDFGLTMEEIQQQFPRIKEAEGYEVFLERGDMLFMPRNCWHHTSYIDASAAGTYSFYPKKFFHLYGYFTGHFYMALLSRSEGGLGIRTWPIFIKLSHSYAMAEGKKKFLFKIVEKLAYVCLLPVLSLYVLISFRLKPRKLY